MPNMEKVKVCRSVFKTGRHFFSEVSTFRLPLHSSPFMILLFLKMTPWTPFLAKKRRRGDVFRGKSTLFGGKKGMFFYENRVHFIKVYTNSANLCHCAACIVKIRGCKPTLVLAYSDIPRNRV
jgi:hypothetical protein